MITQTLNHYLNSHKLNYELVNYEGQLNAPSDDKISIVSTQVLGDTNGYIMALYPSHFELDHVAIEDLLGRQLSPASTAELNRLFPQIDINYIPPLGSLFAVQSIVDNLLFYADTIQFSSGVKQQFIAVPRDDFRQLLSDSFFGNISYPRL